jgi:hypothetical protein
MKIDKNFIILFLMFFCLAAFFFKGSYDDYRLQKFGKETLATVREVPSVCFTRYGNKMKVMVNGHLGNIPLSSENCRNGKYSVGMKIPVMWDESTKTMGPLRQRYITFLLIGIFILISPLLFDFTRSFAKKPANSEGGRKKPKIRKK